MLMLPDSSDRVEPRGGPHASRVSTQVRKAGSENGHDILYAIECGSGAGSSLGGIAESLTLQPVRQNDDDWLAIAESLEFLPEE
jgi:hypothetical protein